MVENKYDTPEYQDVDDLIFCSEDGQPSDR